MTDSAGTPNPLPAHEAAERRDWVAYFDRMQGKPPRATLLHALERFGEIDPSDAPLALDLGCGDGRDTEALLNACWRVWARDGHDDGIRRVQERAVCRRAIEMGRLDVGLAPFSEMELPQASLVNASFSLPFCPPDEFGALWQRIDAAITPGGRFCGQLFGDRDGWSILEDRTHLTRAETLTLFDQYILERFEEEDRPSKQTGSGHKHWHVFHIVARKR
ncbi:MAG: class I SAM-dependent methyltransferase [Planctomycetota bacterium]